MNNKQIALAIADDYQRGKYHVVRDTVPTIIRFSIDGLTIRCRDNVAAVSAVIEKFRKGLGRNMTYSLPRPASTRRRFSIKAFNQFLMDGEPDNAVHYAQLFDWKSMSPEIQASVRHAAGVRSE